jgi:hypothetical protein
MQKPEQKKRDTRGKEQGTHASAFLQKELARGVIPGPIAREC